jgi:hypothetical protein
VSPKQEALDKKAAVATNYICIYTYVIVSFAIPQWQAEGSETLVHQPIWRSLVQWRSVIDTTLSLEPSTDWYKVYMCKRVQASACRRQLTSGDFHQPHRHTFAWLSALRVSVSSAHTTPLRRWFTTLSRTDHHYTLLGPGMLQIPFGEGMRKQQQPTCRNRKSV